MSVARSIIEAIVVGLQGSQFRPPTLAALRSFVASLCRSADEKRTWKEFLKGDEPAKDNLISVLNNKLRRDGTLKAQAETLYRRYTKEKTETLTRVLKKRSARTTGPLYRRYSSGFLPPNVGSSGFGAGPRGGGGRIAFGLTNFHSSAKKAALKKSDKTPGAAVSMGGKSAAKQTAGGSKKPVAAPATKEKNNLVACQFQAQVEKEIKVNVPAAVEVIVSRNGLTKIREGSTGRSTLTVVRKDKQLLIRIRALTECVVEGKAEETVAVPNDNEQAKVYFTITATKKGPVAFQLEFLQGQVLLTSFRLEPTAVAKAGPSQSPLTQRANVATQKPYPTKIIQLFIREQKQGGKVQYQFELDAPSIGIFQQYHSEPIMGNRDAYVRRLYRQIEELGITSAFDSKDFLTKLKSWGADLCIQLLPKELGKALYQNREKIKSIKVISTEPFIPWELLLIKNPEKNGYAESDPFFGDMGLVRWLFGWPSTRDLVLRNGKARYVIPDYANAAYVLDETAAEEAFLKETFKARKIAPDPNVLTSLFKKKNSFDLLHFACHGQADSKKIENASLLLREKIVDGQTMPTYLTQLEVQQSPDFTSVDGIRPIVVVNACEAGRRGFQLTTIGGFAQAFTSHGAGVFVGASWSIGDKAAREFVEAFYKAIVKGKTLSAAAIDARQRTKKKNPLDAAWISYVIYGDPFAKLRSSK